MIRIIDFIASLLGLIVLSPLFLVIAIWIKIDDRKGGVFYKQTRVGKDGVDFGLYKFRSMYAGSDKKGLITIGGRDPRITRSGYYIRKYKLDELPQLINVLKGDMSMVGPRPEVRKYVDLYTEEQRHVLDVRPGITDYASIEYLDENALLALSDDPDRTYVEEIMPAKIRLNMKYIRNKSLKEYLYVIFKTFSGISVDRLVNWYFSKSSLPFWGVFAMDVFISMVSAVMAYTIVNGPADMSRNFFQVLLAIATYMPIFCVTGKLFHSYDIRYRYTTIVDLQKIGGAMFSGSVIVFVIRQIWAIDHYIWKLSGITVLLAALLATLLMMFTRILIKNIYDSKKMGVNVPLAVIYGTQENVEIIAHAVQNHLEHPFRVCGFFTDEVSNNTRFIMGKMMFKKDEKLAEKLAEKGVEAVICCPLMSKKIAEEATLMSQLTNAGIKVLLTPEITHLERNARGDWSNIEMHEFEVDETDMLPHEEIAVDEEAVEELLHGKCVLVTGAAGRIGGELVRQIAACQPRELVLIDQAESPLMDVAQMMDRQWPGQKYYALVASVTNARQMEAVFGAHRPDCVFHAATYKQVKMMEQHPANAVMNNCLGTQILADLAVKNGVKKFVLVSTSKAILPTTVKGYSMRLCEIYCQSLSGRQQQTQFISTRFGKVLDANESVLAVFKRQIKEGGPVTVSHPDKVSYFMLIRDACKLILQAGAMGKGGEIFAFDMGKPLRIVDLARKLIELSAAKNIKIEFTGLHDGEKLESESQRELDSYLATAHPKIRQSEEQPCRYEDVLRTMQELEACCERLDDESVMRKLKVFKSKKEVAVGNLC